MTGINGTGPPPSGGPSEPPAPPGPAEPRRMLRRLWALTITGLMGAQVWFTATGADHQWAVLVNRCLSGPVVPGSGAQPPPDP